MWQAGLGNDGSGSEFRAMRQQQDDPNLRSGNAIMRHYVHTTDGDIGHVQGLIVDEETSAIRYLIVNTSNWWLGHQVLIVPEWIDHVNWLDSKVSVDLTRQAVKDAPEYDSTAALNREQELHIHKHYCRPSSIRRRRRTQRHWCQSSATAARLWTVWRRFQDSKAGSLDRTVKAMRKNGISNMQQVSIGVVKAYRLPQLPQGLGRGRVGRDIEMQ
jgi:hypothetical protein